ncbi:MAG: tandem-95 repeat protein, partial [Microcystis aeruginosa SX13-01]|nr:tandem-95 repeat protein [Microcystis aeruginosa SX13-01]
GDEGDAGNGGGIWGEAGDDLLYGEAGGDALRGGDGNDTIYGGDGNDYLDGGLGDDVLIGVNPNNPIPGLNERDTIVSGTGSDRIILGDTHWLAYDDRNTTTNGTGDYATIADFDVNFDVIQLQGQKNNYRLAISGLDTWLYLDKPGTEPDELIAIIQGKTNLNLDSQNFVYVEPVNTPPTTSDNSLVTDEDTNLVFTANNFNFSDVDSDDSLQAIRLETLPTEGILYVDSNNNGIVNTGETISQGSLVTVAAINAGQLKFKPDANENGTPYTNFTFSVSDGEDLSITPAKITLNVTPINDAPTNIQLTNSNVNENSPINTIIGQISISDPDLNDTHTLTLIDDAGGRFKLVGSQLQVANASLLDYETKTNHSITIKASDTGNLSFEKALTITVNNVNESPSAIQLTNTSINENSPNSTVIGILNTTDPDANNTFTYSLVDNAGGRFAINGNQLIVADGTKLDYEINQKHTITIRTQDQGGLTYDQTFDINLIDVADSSVIAFSQPTYTVKEDGTPITEITLTRSISTQGQVSVTVTPSNGTATSPLDYNNAPITVTFADGETSKKIAIPIVKDTAYEGNETLNLTLSNPTNGATIGTQKTATLTIVDTPITYYLTTPTTWTDAQAQAQAMGGNLVTINDAAENQFLVNAFGSNESFWIGFTDAVQEGDWKWINGEPVTYVNWSLGEPNNNGNEDYGIINDPYDPGPSEKWYDLPNNPPSHFPPQLKGIIEVLNGTSTISIADTTINESENQATVTVKLTGISQQTFTVDYNTNDGTAKAGEDYTTVSGKLTFNAGESVKTITVLINNDTAYEGNETFTLNLSNPTGGAVLGTSTATITIIDDDVPQPGTLAFSNAQFSVNEDGTPVNQIKIIRTGGSQGEVSATINLTNGTATPEDYDIASIPVTFANGETEKFVTIPIANDTLVENTETINLTLINPTNGATLGTQKAAVLSILDDDVQLNFNAANYTVREDGTAVTDIIITRTGRTTGTVGATLNFANGTATGCPCPPASVTYDFYNGAFAFTLDENEMSKVIQVEDAKLAGSNAIRIRNDSKVEGDEYFTINLNNPTGGATIGNQNSATVTILDDDVQLAFSSPTFTIREDGTAIAAVTVNRIGRLTGVVGATLNLDGGNATYPDDYTQTSLNISFAEGENSKIINIPVRNDIISEPDETVNLTLVNPTGGATIGSQNTAILTIVDNGLTPSLSLAIDKDTVAENAGNNAATATITRSIITDEDLIITLNSNDTSEITVPNQVIIPANQASATFTLNAVDDNITDGIQSVTINATANGFSQGVDTINVADINVPDLKIVNLSASTPLLTGKQGSFTYRVVNQGLSEAKGTWTDKIYLSTDTTLETNKDIFLDNYQFSGTIPTGLFYERNLPFFIPKTPGQYYLIAQTDTANTVKEGIGLGENNNTTITSINITPAYRATVSTDTEIGVTGNKVILQGKAFSNSDNSAVPYEFVTIAIKYNGTVRELTAFTDGNGNFVKEFQPLPGEGGQYQINAYFPNYSSEDSTAEDSFKLLGMRFNTGGAYYQINADSPFNATATLQNLTDIPITGITYSIDGAPQDWNIQVSAANTLAGNSNLPITYTITAPNNSPITQDTFNINLTSAEGVSTTLPVTINLRRIVPHLVANTNLLSNGMLRGQQTPIEFTVTNNGGIATGEVQVILPNAPWLKLASPVKLSSLNPGESSKVTLLLAPDANLPLTVYNGNLVLDVVGNDGDLSLPFSFRAVSDAVGSLQITVVDELTFFTESAPKLKDATIILRDYITGNEVRRITTDATGMVSWDNLSEGYYQLEVKAKSHDSYTQTIQIKAGETEDIESFLSRQTVKYVWRVVPTEIEDKYTITIESVFETHVPALDGSSDSIANPIPTVTIDPPLIDLINLQVIGQMMQVDMTVTNNGLIAANNVRLYFGEHPFYKIEPLIDNIGTLGAKSSITVPVRITRIGDFENLENNGLKALAATAQPNVRCTIDAKLIYDYICGVVIDKNGEKFNRNIEKSSPIAFQGVEGNCAYNPVFYTPVTPVTIVTDNHQIGSSLSPIPQVTLVSPNTPVINSSNCCIKLEKIGLDVGGAVDIILDPMEERINKFFEKCISGNGLLKIIGKSLKGIDLSIDSLKAEIGTCCDQNNKNGLTMNGEAKGIIRRNFLPSLEYSTNELIFEDEDEMGKLSYIIPQSDLELKGTPSIYGSIDVKVGKECYKSPQFTASVELGFDLDYGITANWQVSKLVKTTGALVPIDASLVRYLKGGLAVKGQYSSASKKWDTCFYSKGLYFEEYTSIGDKKFSVFDNLNTPDKTETTFNIFPSYVYLGNKNCLQDKQASLLATSLESELIPSFSFEEIFGESEDEFFRLLNLEQAVEEQSLTNQLQVQINQLLQGRGLSPISLTPEDDGTTPPPNPGVCAQVKLQINQDAIMTRSGFLGTLEIDNGNDTNNLENITVTINIKDSQGNTVNNLFGITNPTLSNLTAVDGTGTLLANASGSAEWTFIPTGNAAPNEPTIYSIGGSLSYKENGNNITVPLLSTPVTVFPQAELYLDYFHQRDVFADDPFTVEIEPSVPFSLGILVKNQGKGTAKNLHISSAQPKIIDNEKGLLIDFNIIGTQIGTESITPSLTVNFGNIEAGKTAVADWLFKSDLQGKFTDYKATFEHINDLGKPELSLIKEVKIHELTHQVNVDSDNLPDFLVNDIPDPNFYPDTLYFSNGATAPVNVVTNATATINNQQAQIIVNVNSGWTYLHLTEPSNGSLEIAQVLRSDGTSIKLDNVWTTDRTFPATGRPIYENILHLLDYNANAGNSNYTIIYTSGGPTVTDIIDVTPDPRSTAVNAITIDFSEPIQASTFDYTDLSLTLNNGTNLITNIVSIIPLSTTRYQVTGLENLTNIDGDYQLTVNANGIKDLDGKLGTGLLSETWIKTATGNADNTPPTVTDIRDLQIDPRNIPVSSLDVTLSEAIDLSSFTWEDITLTRNSGSNLINNTVTITPVNDTTYRINGLNNLTQTEGTYTLTVNGNEIKDLSGNLGIGSASEIWVMDTTPPDAPSNLKVGNKTITPNSQNLVNTTTLNLTGDLSETGLSVFLIDRTLNQSLGQASVNNTQFSSTIQLPSSGTRNLDIQIIDPAGNITTTNFNLFADIITPTLLEFLNIPQTPIATPINSIDLRFSEAINLSTFDYTDITLQRNNGENLINDAVTVEYLSGTTYRIKGLTELTTTTGNYQLTVNSNTLQDLAGNSGDAAKTATFAIITPTNNPPIAQDDALATNEDTIVTGNVLINNGSGADSDPDKDSLTVTAVNSNTANVGTQIILSSGALLTLNTNGTLTYNPNGQFEALKNGEITTDSFTYTLSDGNGGTDTATVTATITGVNDAPVANPDSYILTVNLVSTVAKGILTLNPEGSFNYTPNTGFVGTDSFTYKVNDGLADSNITTVTLTVNPINDAPVANPDSYTLDEDNTLTINTPGVKGNDTDAENDSLTVNLVS